MSTEELEEKCKKVKERFLEEGAHFVINTMEELPDLVEKINGLLEEGKTPYTI